MVCPSSRAPFAGAKPGMRLDARFFSRAVLSRAEGADMAKQANQHSRHELCSPAFLLEAKSRSVHEEKTTSWEQYQRKGVYAMDWIVAIIVAVAAAALGAAGGYLYRKQAGEKKIGRTEEYAKNLLEDAQRKADEKKKETILEAKEEVLRLKTELDGNAASAAPRCSAARPPHPAA